MTEVTRSDVRAFILDSVAGGLAAKRLEPSSVPDDFDLLLEGLIDSFGLIELLGSLEARFQVELDATEIDVDVLTLVGPLSDYVARSAAD